MTPTGLVDDRGALPSVPRWATVLFGLGVAFCLFGVVVNLVSGQWLGVVVFAVGLVNIGLAWAQTRRRVAQARAEVARPSG